jgi:Ca-activated chloride channel family protein
VVVATDGYVHVEPQLFDMIRQNLGQANLFPFGVGTAVNRHLIEGMARAGQGEPFVILNASEAGAAAARFRQYIQNPVLTQVKAAFDGFEAYDQEPQQWPDLFAQRPLVMLGKYRGAPGGTIKVTGQTAKGPFAQEIKVDQTQASPDNRALRLLWARQRLMRLSDHEGLEQGQARVKEITDLGLKYSLMTAYTSFVAVDTVKRADGQVVTVQQPLPLPQGVSDLAVGGGRHGVKAKAMPSFGRGGFMAALTPDAKGGGAMPASPAAKPDVAMEPGFTPAAPGGAAPEASSSLSLKIIRIDGHLPAEEVRQVLEAKLTEMEACCQAAAAQGVSLPKDITLTFTIGADGRVAGKVLPKPPLGNGQFTGCLSRLIQGLTFANPGKQPGKVMVQLILGTS